MLFRIQRLVYAGNRLLIFTFLFLLLDERFLEETAQHDERIGLLDGVKELGIKILLFTDELFRIIAPEVLVLPLTDMWR